MPSILHVCQPTVGGAAVAVRLLVTIGVGAGYDVTVACPNSGDLPGWTLEAGAKWIEFETGRQPSLSDFRLVPGLRRLFRDTTITHLHSSKAGALGRVAAIGLPQARAMFFTPHGWSWFVGGRSAAAYKVFERLVAKTAVRIISVSQDEATEGTRVLGETADILIIPNGVDTDAFRPEGPTADRSDEPLLICVGRLTRAKGQDLAIQTLALLRSRTARLRLLGEGEDRADLQEIADRCGVADRVEFLGWVEPGPHLRAADVVLVPSRWDGLSFSLLEAMACGKPIVATHAAGGRSLGDAGVVVAGEDAPRNMATEVDRMLQCPEERAEFGRRARSRATAEFAQTQMERSYLMLWETLATHER